MLSDSRSVDPVMQNPIMIQHKPSMDNIHYEHAHACKKGVELIPSGHVDIKRQLLTVLAEWLINIQTH
jgi:hypothetical protein